MRRQIVIMLLGLMTTLSLPAFAIAGSRESSHATQPYKYIGKDLDRTHGLDWYDHGAQDTTTPLEGTEKLKPTIKLKVDDGEIAVLPFIICLF